MPRVQVRNFDGLFPSVPPRLLKDEASQVCSNLLASAREFRPLGTDTTVVANSGTSNPLTIYRMARTSGGAFNTDMTTGWIVNANHVNYVRGPVEDADERTYYTRGDGGAAPRVRDATGEDRLLGVPAPEVAPTFTVNVVDEFTTEDRTAELQAAAATVVNAVRRNVTPVWRGATHPGTSTSGYLDQTTANGFSVQDDSKMIRAYRLSGLGGTISDSYTDQDDTLFSWVFDPQVSGYAGVSGASPTWAGGAGTHHWCIPLSAYGCTYDIDEAALETELEAILMPGKTDGTKLFTSAQVTEMIDDLVEASAYDGPVVGPMIAALQARFNEVKTLLDGGSQQSLAAMTEAFYSRADVAAELETAKANFAERVFALADAVARSSTPADYTGLGT